MSYISSFALIENMDEYLPMEQLSSFSWNSYLNISSISIIKMISLFEQLNTTMAISKVIKTSNFVFLINVLNFLYIYIFLFLEYFISLLKLNLFIQFQKFGQKLELQKYHRPKNNCN